MPPESPGNLIVLDLEWKNSRLECQVERYDSGSSREFLYVTWYAIECPEYYVPLSGGVASVWVPQGYTHRRYRARVNDVYHGFEWIDVAQDPSGAMLILILPPNYVFASPGEGTLDQSPIDFKATEDGRMAFYWWLSPGRFATLWHMECQQSANIEAECKRLREVRRSTPPAVYPVHIDRPPEEVKVPSLRPPVINEPPEWHRNVVIQIHDQATLHIGAISNSHYEEHLMTEQHFHGGRYQGCNFGDKNSLTNYFGIVDRMEHVEDDLRQKLKEARKAIEQTDLADEDKADVVGQLNSLTAELEKPEKNVSRIQRFWNRIKDVAPTVAAILSTAASVAKLLAGG